MDAAVKQLTETLRPVIHSVLEHELLSAIRSGSLSSTQLFRFACEYQIVSEHFPRNLCAAAALLPNDEARVFLISNLWDEHGRGDPDRSHRTLYRRFIGALAAATEEPRRAPLPSTIAYVDEMLALCGRRDVAAAVGALCFGVESYTSEQYRRTLEGLEKYHFFAEADLEFFRVHIDHDPRHYSELLDIVSLLELVPAHFASLRDGAAEALRLELMMWDGIAQSL